MIANNEAGAEIVAKLAIDAGYDDTIDFYILSDGTISGVGQNNSVLKDIGDNMDVPEFLEKYYGIFTGRGYAWIHSWPALSQAILKGVGPGNFAYYFKQQDYMGMLSTHGSVKYMIDKPHNAYIQYGVHVGWIGMVAFWGFFIFTICRGIKGMKQVSAISDCIASMHLAGIAALIGFLIYSVINDSIITVTPIACMIAGIVLATNFMIERGAGNRTME